MEGRGPAGRPGGPERGGGGWGGEGDKGAWRREGRQGDARVAGRRSLKGLEEAQGPRGGGGQTGGGEVKGGGGSGGMSGSHSLHPVLPPCPALVPVQLSGERKSPLVLKSLPLCPASLPCLFPRVGVRWRGRSAVASASLLLPQPVPSLPALPPCPCPASLPCLGQVSGGERSYDPYRPPSCCPSLCPASLPCLAILPPCPALFLCAGVCAGEAGQLLHRP